MLSLKGKRGLIAGIANRHSIAYGCAKILRQHGAELALTYLNEKAADYVMPLADELQASVAMPCNVSDDAEVQAVMDRLNEEWGQIDFIIHSIAFCPMEDLHGRVVDSHWDSVATAMDISCHSFVRMARMAEPLMSNGGSLLAISYLGAERVVPNYSVMGPVKAALESSAKYMAVELAAKDIRCNILSPGPILTRAAGGVKDFDALLEETQSRSPTGTLPDIEDVGKAAAFLVSDESKAINANTLYVDQGVHSLA